MKTAKDYIELMEVLSRCVKHEIETDYDLERAYDINFGIDIMIEKIRASEFLLNDINK